jgi:hypothetical protein
MIRINPDPHTGGYAYVPLHAVTAFFPAGHDVTGALQELNSAGLADDQIDVFTRSFGEQQLDLEGRKHGLWVRFMRSIGEVLGDEAKELELAEWHLQHGGRVVAAYVHGDHDLKHRAVDVLTKHGGVRVQYWGRWVRQLF